MVSFKGIDHHLWYLAIGKNRTLNKSEIRTHLTDFALWTEIKLKQKNIGKFQKFPSVHSTNA